MRLHSRIGKRPRFRSVNGLNEDRDPHGVCPDSQVIDLAKFDIEDMHCVVAQILK